MASVSDADSRIRNHAVEIRIRTQIHVFDDKKFKKFTVEKNQKCAVFILRPPRNAFKLQAKPPAPRENNQHFNIKILKILLFMGNFCLPESGSKPLVLCASPSSHPFYSWLLIYKVLECGDDIYVYSSFRLFPSWKQD